MSEQIPLLAQYERIKAEYSDAILFFRLGDFYEMFNGDAIEASAILNLTLTHRQDAPMCGVPWHAARAYIGRLLKAGKKVAICEQLNPPGRGKGIIERGVVEVISPGTVLDEDYLDSGSDNYLLALGVFQKQGADFVAMAWISPSTAEFRAASFPAGDIDLLRRELGRLSPREILVRQSSLQNLNVAAVLDEHPLVMLNRFPDWVFNLEQGRRSLLAHFNTLSMSGFGFAEDDPALAAAGAILDYLRESYKSGISHIQSLRSAEDGDFVSIDDSSQRNLEIVRNLRDGSKAYSLLDTVDFTKTAMGARALRRRLLQPLRSLAAINARLDSVDILHHEQRILDRVRAVLGSCLDIERLVSRLSMDKAGPRDIIAIRDTLMHAVAIDALFAENPSLFATLVLGKDVQDKNGFLLLTAYIQAALMDEPALSCIDGPVIRDGFDEGLDRLRTLKNSAQLVLEAYLEEERNKTGIQNLRLKYNKIIGYHIELSKLAAKDVPSHFIRRQSVLNAERFTTARLGELEGDIMSAADRIVSLEKELFASAKDEVKKYIPMLSALALALADLDCSSSSAYCAAFRSYTRPLVEESLALDIRAGRHAVVEAHLGGGQFIPNDLLLEGNLLSFALLTGPNMAGKSTYLRQNAIIVLLAQAGLFVPAEHARIGLCDKLFCRVGAQDNLARGESTFLLEMHETASILNNATQASLVIMDEVGRGTGTQDGLSIAWAVSEYMLDTLSCRTLFATHYHELTELRHRKLFDISMSVEEREGDVVFLKRVVEGPAAGSYGIHVAGLAGIPRSVLQRAESLRAMFAVREKNEAGNGDNFIPRIESRIPDPGFLFVNEDIVLDEIRNLEINSMTPLEALARLAALKKNLVAEKSRGAEKKNK